MDKLERRRRQRLLEIAPTFNNDVPVRDLLDELPCITSKSTREKIKNRERYDSNTDANRELCSSLPGRTGWYDQLLAGLEKVGCSEIAEMMSRDSRGSLLSVQPSSSQLRSTVDYRDVPNARPSTADIPQRNQRHDTHVTLPPVPGERQASMSTTVNHLPIAVRRALSALDLPNDGGLSNNWETLAALLNVTWEESNWLERCHNPSSRIIEAWYEKHPDHATLGNLLQMLEEMNRLDVISEIRKAVGWEEGGADETSPSTYSPVQDPEQICRSLEKRSQYNNNLFDGDRRSSNMEAPRTTRSLPLDLEDQHREIATFSNEQCSNFRDGDQLRKKINNQPQLGPPGSLAMSSSSQKKSENREINYQDFSGKETEDLPKKTKGAPPQDGSCKNTQPTADFMKTELSSKVECENAKSGFTKKEKQGVQKEVNELQMPATDNSLPLDWSKDGERMERRDPSDSWRGRQGNQHGQKESAINQTGKLFGSEPESELVRRKPVNGFQSSKGDDNGEDVDKSQQIPSPQEKLKVNVESRKENLDKGPEMAEPPSTSKTSHRGEASVHEKVCQVGGGQNDFQKKYPECQPDERSSNPNMMTAISRKGTESNNNSPTKEKQKYLFKKKIVKELGLPSQTVSMPAQNSFQDDQVEHDMSDSPAHTLVSMDTMDVSDSDILESGDDSLHTAVESEKSTRVADDSCNKEKLKEKDGKEMNSSSRFVEGKSPVAVGKVNKSPPPNVSQIIPQEPLHPDSKNTDVEGRGEATMQIMPSTSDCNLNGEEMCNERDKEKVGKGFHADKPNKMDQRKDDWKGREVMEDDSQVIYGDIQSIHGDSKKIRNLEDSTEAMGGIDKKSRSTSREENVLITHDFEMGQSITRSVFTVGDQDINDLDQNTNMALGDVSKKPLTSKDFTMLEQTPVSRGKVEDESVVEYEEGVQQSDDLKEDKVGGNDGAHSLPSMSQSKGVDESSASPLPLRSQEPEERERSAPTTHWAHTLATGMASSMLRNMFGNNLSSS